MKYDFFRLFIQALVFVCLTACLSDNPDFDPYVGKPHRVIFTVDPLPANSGGLLLWGKSDRGDTFGRVVSGNSVTVDLNSGNWTYYGMAWTGETGVDENGNTTTNDQMAGVISCAVQTKTLRGDGKSYQTISTFDTTNCNHPDFVPPAMVTGGATDYRIGTVKMNFCESVSNITGVTDICSDNLDSAAAPNRKEAKGHAMSYRISLVSYDKDQKGYKFFDSKLSSGCLSGDAATPLSGEVALSLQQIPAGDGSRSPFYLQVEAFPGDATCSGTTHGTRLVNFPNGINQNSGTIKHFEDGTIHRVFVKMTSDEICQGSSLTQSFAGGNGTAVQPKLICSVSQLFNTIADTTSHFKLLKDIDLTRYYKGYAGSSLLPALVTGAACLKDGSNFLPIGMPACVSPAVRTGDFDGGGKTIKGLRIIMDPLNAGTPDRVGLLSRQGGEIRRITFENAKVTGKNKVGVATGESTGAIRLVEVKNSYVGGVDRIGGIAGQMTSTVANDIKISGLKISATGQYAGGVFASTDANPKLIGKRWYVGGEIRSGIYGGGVLGNSTGGLDLSEVRFEGYLSGNSYLGGVVGVAVTVALTNAYANAGINSTRDLSNVNVGGLIGFLPNPRGSHTISDAYYHGVIRTRCTFGAACAIGNIFGFYDAASWDASPPANVYFSTPRLTATEMSATAWTPQAPTAFISSAVTLSAQFTQIDGDIPRLSGEISWHPCRQNLAYEDVSVQTNATNKRGTASNPILLCNGQQVNGFASKLDSHFKLANYVYDYTPRTVPAATTFTGTIDGDGFGLIGSDFEFNGASTAGFDTFAGTWTNSAFYNPRVVQLGAGSGSIIAYTNTGTLTNMKFLGIEWVGSSGGSIVRDNNGTISNVEVQGYMLPLSNMGGVAQTNSGTIDGMTLNLTMTATAAASSVAGIVKENRPGGKISNVELNVTLETLGATSSNQAIVTTYNYPGATIQNIHYRSGTLKGSGTGAHVIATKNEGTISQVVNEGNIYIKTQSVPAVTPATDAELEAFVTSTVGSNTGTLDDIFYFNEARWLFEFAQRMGVYNGGFGAAPAQDGSGNCIIDVVPSSVPKIQSVAAWNAFINPAGATGKLYFTGTTEFSTLAQSVFSKYPSRVGYDSFLLANNDCSTVAQNTTTWLAYVPGDPHTTAQLSSTLTTWSPWHDDLASAVSVLNLGDVVDQEKLNEYEFKTLIGSTATKPVWVFTPSKGIRLYGR
ncbi:MAG: hypothetical protein ACJ76H_01630 [Bacteriovoracaceae bacterium]